MQVGRHLQNTSEYTISCPTETVNIQKLIKLSAGESARSLDSPDKVILLRQYTHIQSC